MKASEAKHKQIIIGDIQSNQLQGVIKLVQLSFELYYTLIKGQSV